MEYRKLSVYSGEYFEHRLELKALNEDRKDFFEGKREGLREKLINALNSAQEKGLIPLTQEEIAERIYDDTKFTFLSRRSPLLGEYDLEEGVAKIQRNLKGEYLFSTLVHESIHALEGRTVQLEFEEGWFDIQHQRSGVKFFGENSRFRWLDEAITEDLSVKITGYEDDTYETERKIFKFLTTGGKIPVPEQKFYNAFFENYDPQKPYGQRIPAWNELQRLLRESFGPNILLRLDKIIEEFGKENNEDGLQKALETLENEYKKEA